MIVTLGFQVIKADAKTDFILEKDMKSSQTNDNQVVLTIWIDPSENGKQK